MTDSNFETVKSHYDANVLRADELSTAHTDAKVPAAISHFTVGTSGINSGSNEAQAESREKEQFDHYVKKGDLAWQKARKLITLANEQDEFPGGIEASGLQEIYNEAAKNLSFDVRPKNFREAEIYYKRASSTFQAMLGEYSGRQTVIERSKDIGCSYKYSTIHGEFCPPGSIQGESSRLKITCADIDIEKTISERFVTCKVPLWDRIPPWSSCSCIVPGGLGIWGIHGPFIKTPGSGSWSAWSDCLCPILPYGQ